MPRQKAPPIPMFSITQLAEELGIGTSTVSRRLNSIDPASVQFGSPVYRLRDIGVALFGKVVSIHDINAPASDRKAFYQSENERLKFEAAARMLIPAEEVREGVSKVFKLVSERLEILGDELERDFGLAPEVVDAIHHKVRQMKSQLVSSLLEQAYIG